MGTLFLDDRDVANSVGAESIMIELRRLPDWRRRFSNEIDRVRLTPFSWGTHDCGPGLAGNIVRAITGIDVAAPYRNRYATLAGALRVMRNDGFNSLADLAASIVPEYDHVSQARIGDIAAVPMPTSFGFALGAVNGERIFVLMPDGIGTVDLLDATRAFKVG
jgi:hypothetical protein